MNNSKIEWTDHTFNPWWGCEKVSAGCKNCYAEALDNRWQGSHWGPGSDRKSMSEEYWKQPLKWNRAAATAGAKAKVFSASMADVFEGHKDTLPYLVRLFEHIQQTPHLTWQLLTKRPHNIIELLWDVFKHSKSQPVREMILRWLHENSSPSNVWIGTSVENQAAAETRIHHLLQVPAVVHYLSCEPLIGPVNLVPWLFMPSVHGAPSDIEPLGHIQWVIAGGESGHDARPMHPDWVRSLRDQCNAANVPFFFKQWGEYLPFCQFIKDMDKAVHPGWPVRSFPSPHNPDKINKYFKTGKGASGRLLDGVEHSHFPFQLGIPACGE